MTKRFFKRLSRLDLLAFIIAGCFFGLIVYFRYDNFSCRSMQSEAKFYLKEIHAAQLLYFKQHGVFAPLKALESEKRVDLSKTYYNYFDEIIPSESSFLVKAVGKAGSLVDAEIWKMDEKKNLINTVNKCLTKK